MSRDETRVAEVVLRWVTSQEAGTHDVTVSVSDGHGGTDSQSYVLEIAGGRGAAVT